MSHSNHYITHDDRRAQRDFERDARHNGGDWPAGNGYRWRCNDRPPRRQHWTYWKHGGLRSLLNWNRAVRRERAGLWLPMNIELKKEVTQ